MLHRCLVLLPLAACATDPTDPEIPEAPANVATGELSAWQAAPPLPVARANHCSAVIDDWVLVIGGNRKVGADFAKTADIHAARLGSDGELGPWQLAGQAPSPVTECTATSDGRDLVLIDGLYDDETDARQVWIATLDDTGHLSAPTSLGRLPDGQIAIASEATVVDGTLRLMDTRLPAEGDATVTLHTPLAAPLAWIADDWQIGFRAQAQYAFTTDFAFVLGGYTGGSGNPVTTETFVAGLAPGGQGPARATAALPSPTSFGEAVAVDDWVFVVGGRAQVFGAQGTTNVYGAQVDAAGDLGAWQTLAALPMIRTNHELAVVGDYLVLTGGAGTGPGDTTVLTARVRYPRTR